MQKWERERWFKKSGELFFPVSNCLELKNQVKYMLNYSIYQLVDFLFFLFFFFFKGSKRPVFRLPSMLEFAAELKQALSVS